MWIPYDLRGLLVADPRGPQAKAAEADDRQRPFFVGFWLRNPVTQHWETDLSLPAGLAPVVAAGPYGPAELTFHANEAGRLSEVVCHLEARGAAEAVEICLPLLEPRLLALGARLGRGMGVAAWQVLDVAHDQRFRASPNRPSTLDADSDWFATPPDSALLPAMALCQRARAAPDAASRLLAATSALDHMLTSEVFTSAQAAALSLTPQMMLHAGTFRQCEDMQGLSFTAFVRRLHAVVADLMTPEGLWAARPPSQYDTPRFAALANLADLAAHRMMTAELRARARALQAVTELVD